MRASKGRVQVGFHALGHRILADSPLMAVAMCVKHEPHRNRIAMFLRVCKYVMHVP